MGAVAMSLATHLDDVDGDYVHVKDLLHRLPYLMLVGANIDLKGVSTLVRLQGGFLGDDGSFQDLVDMHANHSSASLAQESLDRRQSCQRHDQIIVAQDVYQVQILRTQGLRVGQVAYRLLYVGISVGKEDQRS